MKFALLVCAASLSIVTSGQYGGNAAVQRGNGLFSGLSGCPTTDTPRSFGKENWTHEDYENCLLASGYIRGVVDALDLTPEGVTYGQNFEIIYVYLKNHVNQRQRRSVDIIQDALREGFPTYKGK